MTEGNEKSISEPWNNFKSDSKYDNHELESLKEGMGKGDRKKIIEVIVAEIFQKRYENYELTYVRSSMTPKHKKHKENYT